MRPRNIQHLLVRIHNIMNPHPLPPRNLPQRIHRPIHHPLQQRMPRRRGNRPLPKLDRLLRKVRPMIDREVRLQPDNQPHIPPPVRRQPVLRWHQRLRVKIRVEPAAREQEEVAKKVGLDGGVTEGVEGLGEFGAVGERSVDEGGGGRGFDQGVGVPGEEEIQSDVKINMRLRARASGGAKKIW